MPEPLMERTRLLGGQILPPVLLLAGGPGSGKSTLVRQVGERRRLPVVTATIHSRNTDQDGLIRALRDAFRGTNLSDAKLALTERPTQPDRFLTSLRRALRATDEGIILCLDYAQNLDDHATELLARFAADLPGGHHLAVLTDRITGSLARLRLLTPAIITEDALAFTRDEARTLFDAYDLVLPPRDHDLIETATAGNPAQLTAAARCLADAPREDRDELVTRIGAATSCVDFAVQSLARSRPRRRQLALLAQLDAMTTEMARTCGITATLLDELRRYGFIEVLPAPSDQYGRRFRLTRIVRHVLGERHPPRRMLQHAQQAALAAGEFPTAVSCLVAARNFRHVAKLIQATPPEDLRAFGEQRLASLLDALPPSLLRRTPALKLSLARLQRDAGQLQEAIATLDSAESARMSRQWRARIRLERLLCVIRPDFVPSATLGVLDTLVLHLKKEDVATSARIAEARGLCALEPAGSDSLVDAQKQLDQARSLYNEAGELQRAAACDIIIAGHLALPQGAITDVIDRIDRAVADAHPTVLPVALALRARARAQQGHTVRSSVDLDDADNIAHLLNLHDTPIDETRRLIAVSPPRRRPGRTSQAIATTVTVSVLGGLDVRRDGQPITIDEPDGRTLVEVLGANGGRMHVRELTNTMFNSEPNSQTDAWLDRVCAATAVPTIERQGDFVGFAPGTQLDVWEFLELAREALQTQRGSGRTIDRQLAERALAHYAELLPARDDHWIDPARRRFRTRALELLDALLALPSTSARDRARWAAHALALADTEDPRRQRYTAIAETTPP